MRCVAVAALCAGIVVPLTLAGSARADVTISINKATQNMSVLVDGAERYNWKVSTGSGGGPRAGTYKPQRLEKKWFSRKYGMSPMPSAIFFHEGYAIHGTIYVSRLGQRASHGCVRLHPTNAATLFDLVRGEGMGATTIVISNTEHVAARPPAPPKVEAQALPPQAVPAQAMAPQASPPRETTAKAPAVPVAPVAPATPSTESETDAVTQMSNE